MPTGRKQNKRIRTRNMQWFITPAIVFGTINVLLYYLVGFDTAAKLVEIADKMNVAITSDVILERSKGLAEPTIYKLHALFNVTIFFFMALTYTAILTGSCIYCTVKNGYRFGDVVRFFFKNQTTVPARAASACSMMLIVSMAPMLIMGRTYFVNTPAAGVTMTMLISVSLFILANAEMMSQRKSFSLNEIVSSSLAESGVFTIDGSGEEEKKELHEVDKNVIAENAPGDILAVRTKHIVEKMHAAFEEGKAYANPELTVASMAEMIGTNRTTLSNIVNQQYGVTFRDLTNRYRIDAAKVYIKEHPTATQEEVAVVCGFRSASALNHKFKEIVGMPPTLWLTSQTRDITPPETEAMKSELLTTAKTIKTDNNK